MVSCNEQWQAVYLLRQIRGETLNNIGELLNIKTYSTVSSILRRVSRLKKYDKKFKRQIRKIQASINKGQRQSCPHLSHLSWKYRGYRFLPLVEMTKKGVFVQALISAWTKTLWISPLWKRGAGGILATCRNPPKSPFTKGGLMRKPGTFRSGTN